MRIAMIGTGYVGLVTGACLSEFGVDVVCVDKDAAKIAGLEEGKIPIYEPGLDKLVETNMRAERNRMKGKVKECTAQARQTKQVWAKT